MNSLVYISIGLAVGCISGACGIGGGVLLVPAFVWFCGFDLRKATGTSLAVLALPVSLPAAGHAFRRGQVDIEAVLWIAGAFMVGAITSRMYVDHMPESLLRLLFGLLMVYVGSRFVLSSDSEASAAAAGLLGAGFALVAFLGLRWLGKQHLGPPDLSDEIQTRHEQGYGDPEYHI